MKSIYIWLIVLVVASCGDFLEPKSSDEFIPENVAALDEMLVGEAYPQRQGDNLFLFHNILDDDITITRENVGFADYESVARDNYYAIYTLQPDMFVKLGEVGSSLSNLFLWDVYYKRILGANAALDYVEDMKDDPEMRAFVQAQALALRGFYYFHLVNLFGEPYTYDKKAPGVPLKLNSSLSTGFTGRNSVEEVYEQVLSDLHEAKRLFRSLPARRQFAQNYRVNLPATEMLIARAYLYMGEWQQAADAADSVLLHGEFTLYDLNTFTKTEHVEKPHYSTYDNPEVIWLYGGTGDLFNLSNLDRSSLDLQIRRRFFNASDELLAAYTDAGDLRKEGYIFDEYSNFVFVGNKLPRGKVITTTCQVIDESARPFGMSIRLSEAYLILAEAHAMLGNEQEALGYLNRLRAKRISGYVPLSGLKGDELICFVREERRRELCFEGFRWFDLRRWGMEAFTKKWREFGANEQEFRIEKNDPAFTLPIPERVIERNPGILQNRLAAERTGTSVE